MTRYTWVAIGDSVTEGQGASTRANRWLDRAAAGIRSYHSLAAGGRGYAPVHYKVSGPDSPWATGDVTASSGNVGVADSDGFGYRTEALHASSAGHMTWTFHGTSVDLWYVKNSGLGTFTYAVDGGSTTSINTSAGSKSYASTRISLGTSGSHTIQLVETSGDVYILGFTVYDGDETGDAVITYDAASTGIDTVNYVGASAWSLTLGAMQGVAPNIVTVCLGANDYGGATATPSQVQTNLGTILSGFTGLSPAPTIVVIAFPAFPTLSPSQTHSWSEYVTAMSNAASTASATFLDLATWLPPQLDGHTASESVYYTSGGELSDIGHEYVGTIIGNVLTGQTVPTGVGKVVDNFDTAAGLDTGLWSGTGGTVTLGGTAYVQCDTGYNGLASGASYALAESGVSLKLTPAPAAGASSIAFSRFVMDSGTAGTDLGFEINTVSGQIVLYSRVGYTDASAVTLTYDAANHAWLRLQELSGTTYWDTSPDGVTWTNRRSASTPGWAANSTNAILVQAHRDAGSTNAAKVDNVNIGF